MLKKISWIEIAYLILMTYLIGTKVYNFFSPEAQLNLYFRILRAFDITFYIPYLLTFCQVVFNTLSLIPLFLYIFKLSFLKKKFWQYFLVFNFIFDLTGHPFHINELIGIYQTSPRIAITILLSSVIPYFPKYVACYRYAFTDKK